MVRPSDAGSSIDMVCRFGRHRRACYSGKILGCPDMFFLNRKMALSRGLPPSRFLALIR